MAKIFITGSADGLGQLAAKELVNEGHQVVLHARNADRGKYALQKVRGAADVLIADISSIDEMEQSIQSITSILQYSSSTIQLDIKISYLVRV